MGPGVGQGDPVPRFVKPPLDQAERAVQNAVAGGVSRRDATEMLWALLSIPLWENLTVDRKWSKARYRRRLKYVIRSTFVRD